MVRRSCCNWISNAADDLDAALWAEGPLAEIVRRGGLPSLAGAAVAQQRRDSPRLHAMPAGLALRDHEREEVIDNLQL